MRDARPALFGITALVVAADRISKTWVMRHMYEGQEIPVIPTWFKLSHVQNAGAAFSLFADGDAPNRTRWMLIAFSLLAAVIVLGLLLRLGRRFTVISISLALVLGGALGNVWDRIRYATVTDFLEVTLHLGNWHYHWPDFNLADSAIVTGGVLLVLDSIFGVRSAAHRG